MYYTDEQELHTLQIQQQQLDEQYFYEVIYSTQISIQEEAEQSEAYFLNNLNEDTLND